MPAITVALLRKRAEHNEGCLSNLKEITLHQQEIEKIEVIGDMCRELEIIYLCNNYIPRIEGLRHLKCLKYLNLAVNNITVIEGLEGCEMLEKLDLTLNFVEDLNSVASLKANAFLEHLHLTGNPCTKQKGYRRFVIDTLPHLSSLDSEEIIRSEAIIARQDKDDTQDEANVAARNFREQERIKQELIAQGIDPFPVKLDPETGERLYGHTPEERIQMLRETQAEEEKRRNPPKDPNSISALHEDITKPAKRLTPEEEIAKYGNVIMRNEGKLPFKWDDSSDVSIDLHVEPGKFVSTTLINVDVHPTYVRVTVKDKLLCLHIPEEVAPDQVKVQRSQTSGSLKIMMPFAAHILQKKKERKERYMDAVNYSKKRQQQDEAEQQQQQGKDQKKDDRNEPTTATLKEVEKKQTPSAPTAAAPTPKPQPQPQNEEQAVPLSTLAAKKSPSRVEELDD